MANNRIVIKYDGKVGITKHSLNLGDYSAPEVIHKALGLSDEYAEINAEVEITIVHKPDSPRVLLNGELCALGGGEKC